MAIVDDNRNTAGEYTVPDYNHGKSVMISSEDYDLFLKLKQYVASQVDWLDFQYGTFALDGQYVLDGKRMDPKTGEELK